MMKYWESRAEQEKEMDRFLKLEKHCLKSLEKSTDNKIQKELLSVLDSIQRQKKQLSEDMHGTTV